MERFFKKKVFSPFITIVIALSTALAAVFVTIPIASDVTKRRMNHQEEPVKTVLKDEELFDQAMEDVKTIKEDEIYPLISLTPEDKETFWKEGKVLMVSWENNLIPFTKGDEDTFTHIWCYSQKELQSWFAKNNATVMDWNNRFAKLLGENPSGENTDFVGIWVDPAQVYRPAYQSDSQVGSMTTTFSPNTTEKFRNFFEDQVYLAYYGDIPYPWTRLGYSYDWEDNQTKYGLTEFMTATDTPATVEFDYSTDEFVEWLKKGGYQE